MNRRRAARTDAPLSTLSGALTDDATTARGVPASSLRRVRKWLLRLGAFKSALCLALFAAGASLAIAMAMNVVFQPPPSLVWFTLTLSVGIPLIVAPVPGWYVVRLMFEAEGARRTAERMAVTDPLTLAFNRRHFFHVGERELQRSHATGGLLSVLLLDVDNFKSVNDQHGHAIGDRVLKQVALACASGVRDNDLLARVVGEEFVALLPATSLLEAASVAERLRCAVESLAIAGEGGAMIRPTVSIGVASVTLSASSLDSLLASADRAMYMDKRSGRNRVISGTPPT